MPATEWTPVIKSNNWKPLILYTDFIRRAKTFWCPGYRSDLADEKQNLP